MKKILILCMVLMPVGLKAETFSVLVQAGSEVINAVEGTLVLPPDVRLSRISTGDSAVLIWITPPTWEVSSRSISFAGLSPGGFTGSQSLFTIELKRGTPSVAGGVLSGYRNDGQGTKIQLEYLIKPGMEREDHEWPEPFTPLTSWAPDLFGGAHILSFNTQDKGTGVDHYEYASSWLLHPASSEWVKASSPQRLSFLEGFKKLYVRAYDARGSYREEAVPGPYRSALIIGSIIIICLLFFAKRFFRSSF